jgi:hypothetical protein
VSVIASVRTSEVIVIVGVEVLQVESCSDFVNGCNSPELQQRMRQAEQRATGNNDGQPKVGPTLQLSA